jgi:hypothetical protein
METKYISGCLGFGRMTERLGMMTKEYKGSGEIEYYKIVHV